MPQNYAALEDVVYAGPDSRRWWPAVALGVAGLAATALVALPLAPRAATGQPPEVTSTSVPADMILTLPTQLSDGSSYALRYVIDSKRSIGASLSADGASFRLVELIDGEVHQLRSLQASGGPQFDGFAHAHGNVYWVETVINPDYSVKSSLWSASIAGDGPGVGEPQQMVADMGYIVIYDSVYDLIVADGVISWVTASGGMPLRSILRTMPVAGGPITDRSYVGAWRQTTRPWLLSATTGSLKLLNADNGVTVDVAGTGAEGVACTGQWCRFTISSTDGPVRLDLVRPGGSQRTRIAGPGTRFEALDPAMLGRYEILSQSDPSLPEDQQRLLIYDIERATTREIEIGMTSLVTNRGEFAWWLSGDIRSPSWHVLDLKALGMS